jgi:hypothetical protein
MKSIWKWILGIVIVLILCAAVVGGGFFAFSHRFAVGALPEIRANQANDYAWGMPMHRGFVAPNAPYHQREFGPGMVPQTGVWGGRGMMPFGGGFMLFGGLIRLFVVLAILGLVGFVAYRLGKQAGLRTTAPSVVAPPPPPPAPEAPEKGGEDSPQ